jgi:hypothetical protein
MEAMWESSDVTSGNFSVIIFAALLSKVRLFAGLSELRQI